ncbi:S8/S53 family peptidase [Roseobacter sinensis]|uniref:S8/S53 family peptidase n=1 Tax=Roseobacter sinensis TaxID=2931391 RepID=A0ABT3BGM8_9RHOB|nr:S8/S53 family peptidase [Roseobacter sp. WL0113]MCV3272745.1 S8/S53 family peptidase [Roseobacter sp. WL0113]
MSERHRYFIWRGVAGFDDEVRKLIAISFEYEQEMTRVTDEFAVVFVTEEDIRSSFPSFEEGQIVVPQETKTRSQFNLGGQFLLGVDAPIALAEHGGRRNVPPAAPAFDRLRAETLIDADALRAFSASGCQPVNVVIVDGGLDEGYLSSIGYTKGVEAIPNLMGSKTQPHVQETRRHANAVARSVLSIAPDVKLVDAPILPDRIENADLFASRVIELIFRLLDLIGSRQDESWVVVCAWGLLDRKYDRFLGTYADDRRHPLSVVLEYLVSKNVDVIFSAGNNGMFWPDPRSGPTDRGPFQSIMGSNGLGTVLTVGAVDAIGQWIGESAQGPEPAGLRSPAIGPEARKPDVCAPSWFRETDNRHAAFTGTSGACAVAAGVVAAVRTRVPADLLSPAALIDKIRETARREGYTEGSGRTTPAEWRFGSGIIDCAALADCLERLEQV